MIWNWAWGLLGLLALPTRALYADSLGDAYRAFEKGQFEEAAKGFQSHAQKKPDDYDQLYNTGVALFQKGAHEEALSYFDRAMQSPDPLLKSRAAYNKGVALAQKQKWEEAEAAFQDALSYDNENKMIQDNLQFAREQKNRQKKEEPQDNQAQQPNQQPNEDAKADEKQAENQPGQPQGGKPEKKQADNQQGQAQSAEGQQSAQEKAGQKSELQEKSAQSEAQKQAQDKAAQADAQKQAGQADPQKEAAQAKQSAAEKQAEQEKSGQSASEQQAQLAQPQAGKPDGQKDREGQRVLTIKDLKKQEAEKLLRSVDDRIGSYILTPEQANTEGKSRNGKDW